MRTKKVFNPNLNIFFTILNLKIFKPGPFGMVQYQLLDYDIGQFWYSSREIRGCIL